MFEIDKETKEMSLTRGNHVAFTTSTKNKDGSLYEFQVGDIVRFKVFERKKCNCVVLEKDIEVKEVCTEVDIELSKEETTIGELINKPVKYWYEIELNPNGKTHTIVGYDKDGEKILKLYPEGGEKE